MIDISGRQHRLTRGIKALSLVLIVVGGLGFYRWKSQQDAVTTAAQGAVDCILRGDTDHLYENLASSMEIDSGLTKGQLKAIYEITFKPRLKYVQSFGTREGTGYQDVGISVVNTQVTLVNGQTHHISLSASVGDGGPKMATASTIATNGWQLEYLAKQNGPRKEGDLIRATLQGVRTDRARLEAAGIKGLFIRPGKGLQTWDEIERQTELALQYLSQRQR